MVKNIILDGKEVNPKKVIVTGDTITT